MNKVWAITMVRNEADIIKYTLSHLISQGVDGILVLDNNSEDDTVVVAMRANREGVPVIIYQDGPGAGYEQAKNMTMLSDIAAREFGATYVVPFDADELWYSERGKVADLIREAEGFISQAVPQFFHFCTVFDDQSEPNPYNRIAYRTKEPMRWLKNCFKWSPGVRLGGGQHTVMDANNNSLPRTHDLGIRIRHVPCRSFEQFANKIIRHGVAMDIQYPNDPDWSGDGPAHKYLYRGYQKEGISHLERIWFNGWGTTDALGFVLVKDPEAFDLVRDPAPYTGTR